MTLAGIAGPVMITSIEPGRCSQSVDQLVFLGGNSEADDPEADLIQHQLIEIAFSEDVRRQCATPLTLTPAWPAVPASDRTGLNDGRSQARPPADLIITQRHRKSWFIKHSGPCFTPPLRNCAINTRLPSPAARIA